MYFLVNLSPKPLDLSKQLQIFHLHRSHDVDLDPNFKVEGQITYFLVNACISPQTVGRSNFKLDVYKGHMM